jgi:glycosyltransferase involved in cell wall biosynthesis
MKILFVQPSLAPPGGGNLVAAWMLEALRAEHDLTLLAWDRPNLPTCNRFFGTSLTQTDFTLRTVAAPVRRLAALAPLPLALLRHAYLTRRASAMAAGFDLVMTADNEADLGGRGIQYIHYPKLDPERPAVDLRWYHASPRLRATYRALGLRLAGAAPARRRANLTLVNSDFIGARVRALHGIATETLHPPVPGEFPAGPWEARDDGFVVVGRISPEKRLEDALEIIRLVQGEWSGARLHLVGSDDDRAYTRRIRALVRKHAAFASLHHDLARDDLLRLVAHQRYGLHAMPGEHFGIAVAEMVRAGCIPFVPDTGGPLEIVGDDQRLCFSSPADAVAKILATLRDRGRQEALRAQLARRAPSFSSERFVRRVREIVRDFR